MAVILVLEDDALVSEGIRLLLERHGYDIEVASTVADARAVLLRRDIDVVVCDITLPGGESGMALVREITSELPDTSVFMLTGIDDLEIAVEALALGATAYVVKPFLPNEILINVVNSIRVRDLERQRRSHAEELEGKLLDRGRSLQSALGDLDSTKRRTALFEEEIVERLTSALALRDEETGAHIERMSRYSVIVAREAGVDTWDPDVLRMACALHDVGKIGVPDAVLQKPGALNDVEFDTIRRHPEVGYRLLADSASDILHLAARVALTHHERWDGTGYPRRLVGTGIPLEGRIAAVADVFDAVTNRRVYRRAWEIDEAVAHLRDNRGRHFDPDLVDALLSGLDDALAVREQYPDDDPSAIVKVLVVDDHRMFAESVSRLLAAEPDVQVVATVGSAADAWAAVRAEAPDVVLMDWALPDGDGLETAKGIRGEHPEVNVVLLTGVGDGPLVAEALKAGCCGFLRKDQAFDKLARAVRAAAQGESIVPAAQIVAALGGLVPDRPGPVGLLTGRELAVLSFAARGLRNDVIADRLQLSLHSVRNHVRNASAKLDSHSKLEAVTTAVRQGLISLS